MFSVIVTCSCYCDLLLNGYCGLCSLLAHMLALHCLLMSLLANCLPNCLLIACSCVP